VHWVEPRLVAEVAFTEWTREGRLRHPVFRGLREDKDPEEIRMAEPDEQEAKENDRPRTPAKRGATEVAGVGLTNPDRVLYPRQGITKLALARYYEEMADWILPQIRRRPLSLLRCPQGRGKDCFFQKHPGQAIAAEMPRVSIREKSGTAEYLYVEQLRDLVALVQAGTLELHAWGCTVEDVERPDVVVFDLDPGPGVDWPDVLDAARSLQDRLRSLKLEAFLRTTGGKGLHLVVPLRPGLEWDGVKAFAKTVAAVHAREDPGRFTINMSKAKRRQRIFLDYLRNGRGNTAIVSYSTRAREGAPVAVPVRRDELKPSLTGDRYDIDAVGRRVQSLRSDPWQDFERSRRRVTPATLRALGVKEDSP
jgi:bifunctional non-homologous end joining protein LigD